MPAPRNPIVVYRPTGKTYRFQPYARYSEDRNPLFERGYIQIRLDGKQYTVAGVRHTALNFFLPVKDGVNNYLLETS